MERELKIFRGQCLNLAMESMKQDGIKVIDNLDCLFERAKTIYEKGKTTHYTGIL